MNDNMDTYVVVYNGLAQSRSTIVHLPVSSPGFYTIEKVDVGAHPSTVGTSEEAIPVLESEILGGAPYRVPFLAAQVPPLGASMYKIFKTKSLPTASRQESGVTITRRSLLGNINDDEVVASNQYFTATFNGYVHPNCGLYGIVTRVILTLCTCFADLLELSVA